MKIPFFKYSICNPWQNFVLPKSYISNSFFKQFIVLFNSSGVPMILISSTYTEIIANSLLDLFMNIHGHIGSFLYPSFRRYSLSQLYHIRPDCFNLYKDFSLIEYCFHEFKVHASGSWNPSGIFICLYINLYIYVIIFHNTSNIWNPSRIQLTISTHGL